MGLVHFDQATKHYLLALYMQALLSLVLSLSQAQARSGNQTHPTGLALNLTPAQGGDLKFDSHPEGVSWRSTDYY
jgi:hypothetical protein